MTDRELLAASAMAMKNIGHPHFANFTAHDDSVCLELGHRRGAVTSYWNPRVDDGDAFRLAVTLGIHVIHRTNLSEGALECVAWCRNDICVIVPYGDDPHAATRRAIVCAAAVIGKLGSPQL